MQALKLLRQIAIISLVLYGVFLSYETYITAAGLWDPEKPYDNSVDKWQKRIIPVKDLIPPGVTSLGYVADWDLPGIEVNVIDQDSEYMLTQYALAPIKVKPGLDQEWIIGNFTTPGFMDWLDEQMASYDITSLSHGIYLIHRTRP